MESLRTNFAVLLSFILALCLSIMPLPHLMFGLRPNLVTLALIYWVVFLPGRIGIYAGFTVGIVLDIMRGNFLGTMGLTLVLVAFITIKLRPRLNQGHLSSQLWAILLLISLEQLTHLWLQLLFADTAVTYTYWLPIITSVIIWPLLFVCLQSYQRNLKLK